jgi:medium-chain acyl-[acyl-carrier-protein] hydrolase
MEIRTLNGMTEEMCEMPDLLDLAIPVLRDDFALAEGYAHVPASPLECGIAAFGGLQDQLLSTDDLEAWREQTTGSFVLRMLPGDHFFIHTAQAQLLRALSADLEELLARGGGPPGAP